MNLKDLPLSEVTVCTRLHYPDGNEHPIVGLVPLKAVSARQMVQQSLNVGGRACCSLIGGFGFLVDGNPWYGQWISRDDRPPLPYFGRIDHWDDSLAWLDGVADLVAGNRTAAFGMAEFEDCIATRDRWGTVLMRLEEGYPEENALPFRTALIPFALELLREGKAFLAFTEAMSADLNRRLQQPGIDESRTNIIQKRLELIDYWAVGKKVSKLEAALEAATSGKSMALAWENLQEMMALYPPEMSSTTSEETEVLTFAWKTLPEAEITFLKAMEAAADETFEWQNPWRRQPLPHRFHDLTARTEGGWVLALECQFPIPKPLPEYPIHRYDSYLVVQLQDETGPPHQQYLANVHCRQWYDALPLDREWLEVAMAIGFNGRHWNGDHLRESNLLLEQAHFPPARLEHIVHWFEAVTTVLTSSAAYDWDDGTGRTLTLQKAEARGYLQLCADGLPTKVVETRYFADSLFPELDLLTQSCSHLEKLDTKNQLFPWLPRYLQSLKLPTIRARLKAALNHHSIAARTARNQRV